MDHTQGSMSGPYVPRKRKTSQPKQKSGVPLPVVQRVPDRACEMSVTGPPRNYDSQAQAAQKMKRTYGRKRYEDLQNVPMGTAMDDSASESSCGSVVSSSLSVANGTEEPPLAPPPARLPHRLVAKDSWPNPTPVDAGRERGRPQDSWPNPGPPDSGRNRERGRPQDSWPNADTSRERGQSGWSVPDTNRERGRDSWSNPGPDTGRERGRPQDCWPSPGPPETGRERAQSGWTSPADSGRDRDRGQHCWPSPGPGPVTSRDRPQDPWPNPDTNRDRDFALKKMQRVEVHNTPSGTNFPQEVREPPASPPVSGRYGQSSPVALPLEEQKTKSFVTKKEPPVYPPGSQEERWQLQILGKGRVTCTKCKSVSRKTVEGLKKHMESCRVNPFTCQHCGKQLKSSTGMKYHLMADHNNLPSPEDGNGLDEQSVKEKLRKVLKRMGKLKCSKEGCTGSFTSIMGYLYHMKKCGKEESELEKLLLNCRHCGKAYKSKAGLEYHLKSEHGPAPQKVEEEEVKAQIQREANPERTSSGRVKRMSAQVAVFHLQEIANEELLKEWPKRKVQRDLVPDDKKLKYARPGLPAFSQEVLRKWKNEVKLQRKVQCPNQGCDSVYTSVSGLKAHLGLCTRGDFEAGKYKCLICDKEFNSESGVKYHINSVHSQDWFVVNKKASKNFEKLLKTKPKEVLHNMDEPTDHQHHPNPHPQLHHQHPPAPLPYTPGLEAWPQDRRTPPGGPGPGTEPTPQDKHGATEGKRRERGKGRGSGKHKDCYEFSGSDSHSSSSSASSSSESETEEPEGQRQHDQWALKRPSIIEARPDVAKRPRSDT